MKLKPLLMTILMGCCLTLSAQNNITVKSFQLLPMDMTASSLEGKRIDQNGEVAALIKVMTTETGFVFEGGTLGIVNTQQRVGEIWVWVPRGSRKITILHQQLGGLRDYRFPVEIESERTYELVLEIRKVGPKPNVTSQYLLFNLEPKDAVLTVDGETWPVMDGIAQKMVDFGNHEYRVEASDYHTDAGKIDVYDADNTVEVTVNLKPAFGYLKLTGNEALLSKASIYIDNSNGADALKQARKLKSGQHKVRVVHTKYKPFEKMVTISDGETATLNVNLDANFSTVTLKVDADAEIWVDNSMKGVRTWTGDLEAGNHVMETRQKSHRTTTVQKTITEKMSGQTIQLDPPTPITGMLMVSSLPPKAKLIIDGKEVGETPKRINDILVGEHTVRLEKQGCAPLSKTITIEEGKTFSMEEKLDTGRSVMVKTDRTGDKVYVDGEFVGETPRETALSFGRHTLRVVRNGVKVEREVIVTESSRNGQELLFEFGRLIAISTDQNGDVVMVDGVQVGVSPLSVDLPYGSHSIHAERGKKYADKNIEVLKTGGETSHRLVLHGETLDHFLKNGVNFATLDFAYSPAPQTSFGATFGSVKKIGWFVTAASNFQFDALKYDNSSDANGLVDGYYPNYSGESTLTRYSIMGGLVVKLGGPVCFRLGAGYGERCKSWKTTEGYWVKISNDSFSGLDATAGLQLNLKGFTMSVDAVTSSFQTLEVKLGLGYCWKKK